MGADWYRILMAAFVHLHKGFLNPHSFIQKTKESIDSDSFFLHNDNVGHFERSGVGSIKKATMTEIAQHSGVSLKTVSRVINHSEKVSEATRIRVEESMEELGFQVNLLAKGLKQNRTNIIIVFLDRHNGEYLNSWRNIMLRHLFRHARNIGLKIIISPSDSACYAQDETDGFNLLSSGIADGAILLEYVQNDKRVMYLQKTQTPFVILGQPIERDVAAASLDNYQAGFCAGEYLRTKGYQNSYLLTGRKEHYSSQLRAEGFQRAVQGRGTVIFDIGCAAEAYGRVRELILVSKPDAFAVSGDERAAAVYKAIYEGGKRIPEDIAVLGLDDLPVNRYLYPALSCLKQDFNAIAMHCIRQLERMLKNEQKETEQIFLPSMIAERDSVK